MEDTLDRFYNEDKTLCKCDKCRLDAMTRILNRMPPKYITTRKGNVYTRLESLEVQFRADVIRETAKALAAVSRNPRH